MWSEQSDIPTNPTTPPSDPGLERRLATLGAAQHGIVTAAQLLDLGLQCGAVKYRLQTGRLHTVHKGVYAVAYVADHPLARAMAAVLACGPQAALSHASAAALWGIVPTSRGIVPTSRGIVPTSRGIVPTSPPGIDVTAPTKRHHRGIRTHRARLSPNLVTVRYRIPVTTLPRTLLDLAATQIDDRQLARALNEARILHRMPVAALERIVTAPSGHRGVGRIIALLVHDDAPTRSAFEDTFMAFVEHHGLPRPEINQRISGYEVDALWLAQRLIVELDGRRFHETRFEQDREKDATLLAAGYRVVRITWRRLVRHPAAEAKRLASLLDSHV